MDRLPRLTGAPRSSQLTKTGPPRRGGAPEGWPSHRSTVDGPISSTVMGRACPPRAARTGQRFRRAGRLSSGGSRLRPGRGARQAPRRRTGAPAGWPPHSPPPASRPRTRRCRRAAGRHRRRGGDGLPCRLPGGRDRRRLEEVHQSVTGPLGSPQDAGRRTRSPPDRPGSPGDRGRPRPARRAPPAV